MKFQIFVVDDDRHYARLMSYRLEKNLDHRVQVFPSGEDALARIDERPHLVLLDIMMPGIGGIETLRRIREASPESQVVMVSAQGVLEVAVEAMKLGAYDYVTKGQDDLIKIDSIVRHVSENAALRAEVDQLRTAVQQRYSVKGLIGDSPAMQHVYRLVEKALRGDLTVAILGESGTGKELVARAIHYASARKRGPFVVVNCAAIPHDLMESEFFGHEKGSFTGATARKIGKFEQADGGTIFLDEIGEMNIDLQAKLLRALQSREIVRVGGNETITFDARVISATNRDVPEMIRAGTFREDLYYRLYQYPLPIPPLREREGDLLQLAEFFLRDYLANHPQFKGKRLGAAAKRVLLEHAWPGNVREMKSAIERSVLISDHDEIQPADLMLGGQSVISPWAQRFVLADVGTPTPPATQAPAPQGAAPQPHPVPQPPLAPAPFASLAASEVPPVYGLPLTASPPSQEPTPTVRYVPDPPPAPSSAPAAFGGAAVLLSDLDDEDDAPPEGYEPSGMTVSLEEMKQQAVLRAYRQFDGNVDRAAVELGIGRATMYRLLKKYGVMR